MRLGSGTRIDVGHVLRQTEGLIGSIVRLLGLTLAYPTIRR